MSDYPSSPSDYIAASYRYLRLAMVILVVTLGVSLVIEIRGADCLQGSISAYYYTPVNSIFVGALVAIGVSLVALKGRDIVEDLFFTRPACSHPSSPSSRRNAPARSAATTR